MDIDSDQEFDGPSKSQRKREAHQLQDLGTRLSSCTEAQLRVLQLPEKTITAIAEYNRLPNSHGARRRQMQFIGKLMRKSDFEQLNTALERLERTEPHKPKPLSQSKQWAADILLNGDQDINSLMASFPHIERQKLRQFYRDYHAADLESQHKIRVRLHAYLQPFLN